jgi:hypothetical protein
MVGLVPKMGGNAMGLSNREYVGRALEMLASSLAPHIASVLDGMAPGVSWPKLLEHKDVSGGDSERDGRDRACLGRHCCE